MEKKKEKNVRNSDERKRVWMHPFPMSVIDTIVILHIYDDNICDFEVYGCRAP